MKCKFCDSPEELKWPENYKKGDRPVNAETGKPHECRKEEPKPEKPIQAYCHEDNSILKPCDNPHCPYCYFSPLFCPNCNKHPQVIDKR